jgi:hypothetical protein
MIIDLMEKKSHNISKIQPDPAGHKKMTADILLKIDNHELKNYGFFLFMLD